MAKKVIIRGSFLLQSLTDPWGGINETDHDIIPYSERGATTVVHPGEEWGMNRGEVERFNKLRFGTKKVGCLYVTPRKQTDNFYHIWGFATETDRDTYLAAVAALQPGQSLDEETAALRLADEAIPINEDQGTTYTARLTLLDISGEEPETLDPTLPIVSVTRSYNIGVRFCGIQNDNGEISNAGESGTLTVQRSTDATNWTTVGAMQLISLNTDSNAYTVLDLGQWFTTTNPQQFRLRVAFTKRDDEGNEIATAQSAWQVISDVTYTQLTVRNMQDWTRPIQASEGVFPLRFAVTGTVRKWLHVTISGSLGTYTHVEEIAASTEFPATNPRTWSETEKQNIGILTHGIHTVTAWLTCDDGSGHLGTDGYPDGLSSEVVVNRFMVVNTETQGADLTKPYLMLQQTLTTVQNYVRAVLTHYAVWVPDPENPTAASSEPLPISIRLTDSAENDTDYTTEYVRNELSVLSGTDYALDTTVEIEGDGSSQHVNEYLAYLRFFRYGANEEVINFMRESVQAMRFITITVDNSKDFAPVAGAWFSLSPRTRNNSETNKFTIINHQTGEVVPAEFHGFGGINDLWTEDENGQKVLRVLAGQELEIFIDPYGHFANDPRAQASVEFDYAVHNSTAEDAPVIDITQEVGGETLGLRMLPMEGTVKCKGRQETNDQDFGWGEDERTHLVQTIDPAVIAKADDELTWQQTLNGAPSLPLSLSKVYINGDPQREMDYTPTAGTWVSGDGHTVKIGNPNADIDIYGIKFYRTALSAEQVRQNRKAALPTAEEKVEFENRNAITTNGRIDYDKAKTKGFRCLTLVGQDQYKLNQSKDPGYPCYWRIDHDDSALSGTIGKAAYLAYMAGALNGKKCLMVTPQGSTANTYWDNNEQTKVDKITFVINIPFSKVHADFGWKAAMSTGDDCSNPMYLDGQRIEGTTYADLTDEQKARVTIDVVDGWFDGNGWSESVGEMGMYHGQFYTTTVGGPKCQKLVNKINYASPMQSHKMGATRLYNDIMKALCGNEIHLHRDHPEVRFSVCEESFLFFTEHPQDNGKVEFRGMCTFGNGKFDKEVFGYKADKNTFGFEGLNNNLPLCDFRVPADEKVTYNPDDEAWGYNGVKSFEYGLGKTQVINGKEYPTETNDLIFRRYVNFIYTHTPRLKYYNGTLESFLAVYEALVSTAQSDDAAAAELAEMQKWQWWATQGNNAFHLVRFDYTTETWVDAGTWDQENLAYNAGVRDLTADSMTAAAYTVWQSSPDFGDWAALNKAFKTAIAMDVIDHFGSVAVVSNHLGHYNVVNYMEAGTDNCSKNLYYQYDPGTGLIFLDQDDLDSIKKTDNNGRQTKKYFLDRIHDVADYEAGYKPQIDYEGRASALFDMIEEAYENASDGLRQNMRRVLTIMAGLVGANEGYDQSVMGCIDKYFFSIQKYFPEVAYAEQARLRYEWPKSFGYISFGNQARGIDPITQQVGSQLENERQYMKRRMALIASYACWGDFSSGVNAGVVGLSDSGSSLSLSPGSGHIGGEYKFRVVPHQWLYPTGMVDRTAVDPHVRVAPGEEYEFKVANAGDISGDSSVGLAALNYYRKIGNVGNMVVGNNTLSVTAKRLTEFIAEPSNPSQAQFAPGNIALNTPNLKKLSLKGCQTIAGSKDYTSLTRAEEIDLRGTNITGVVLPVSQLIETLQLPATMTAVSLTGQPNLATFTMEGYAALESLTITGSPQVNTQTIVLALYEAQQETQVLTNLTLKDLQWSNLPVNILSWMADLQHITINGTIGIFEDNPTTNAVTFDLKDKFNRKWGNVDNAESNEHQGLLLSYRPRRLESASVKGNFYNESGTQFPFTIEPNSAYVNAFTKISWSMSGLQYTQASIDPMTGLLTVESLSNLVDTATITAMITTYYEGVESAMVVSKDVQIYNRKAQLGDYVYHDGTYSSPDTYTGEKYVIGHCCYLAPVDNNGDIVAELFHPEDKQKRLMVARSNVSATGSTESGGLTYSSWQWGAYRNTSLGAADYASLCIHDLVPQEGNNFYHALKCPEANLDGTTFYDIPTIVNLTGSTFYITDANMRDELSTLGVQNHGFKPFPYNVHYGDGVGGGSVAGSEFFDGNIGARTLTDALATLAGNGYSVGDIVNSGYAKTLKIIEHRNKILNNGVVMIPANDELGTPEDRLGPLEIPHATSGQTELQNLASLMGNLRQYMASHFSETNVAKWTQLYYPAASAAYAYQPSVPSNFVLADKFKAHNWFLPPEGILDRIHWYLKKGADSELNIFRKALAAGLFVNFSSSTYWSSTEYSGSYAWYVYFGGTYSYYNYKTYSYYVRAVAAF